MIACIPLLGSSVLSRRFPRISLSLLLIVLLMVLLTGCPDQRPPSSETSPEPSRPVPLRVLVVGDPPLAEAIQRQWESLGEGQIEVQQVEAEELAGQRSPPRADAIVYPSGLLGELAERQWLVPVPSDVLADPQLDRRDIFELLRMREVSWGERVVYALPLGSPQLTLYYRADLLERLGLEPPGSWSEYQELAARLAQRAELGELAPAGDAAWYGAIEPLGPGWAGQVLLARAAAYARHRSQYSTLFNYSTMEPLIAGPPFVRALEELVEAAGAGPAEAIGYGPAEARQRFLQGEAAMAWSWPTAARSGRDVARAGRLVPTGFAELPGSSQVYNFRDQRWETRTDQEGSRVPLLAVAGRLASVTRQSRQPRPAFSLLVWLSGTELSDQVAPHSRHTTLFRTSHLQRPQLWMEAGTEADTARQYGEVVQQTQSRSSWLFALRIAGRAQYLAALDDAVHQALSGDKTAAEALEQAAARWQQITQSLGQQDQQRAYMRSLGLEL